MLCISLCAPGCASVLNSSFLGSSSLEESEGLTQVDDLLGRIERVHVEAQLSKESAQSALAALSGLVAPDFGGDPMAAYAEFVAAIDRSEEQAEELRGSIGPMKATADAVFRQWAFDLEAFGNVKMRQRSQVRLEATRSRYEALLAQVEPAMWAYDSLNQGLRDHALYFSHDFNAAAVAAVELEVYALADQAAALGLRFDACLAAAEDYVRAAALRGQIEVKSVADADGQGS